MGRDVYMRLVVDRLKSDFGDLAGRSLVEIDPDVMAGNGLKVGDVVLVSTQSGKYPTPARLAECDGADKGSRRVRLDRYMRAATKAKLNEEVEVRRLEEAPPLKAVSLLPPIDLSTAHHLVEHIHESLARNRTPLGRGSVVYSTFPGSNAGTTYRVTKADPAVGIVDDKTSIHLETPSGGGVRPDEDVTFEDVGGMQREIKLIRELVQLPLQLPQVYRRLGIVPPRGVLFYGPPGGGKTYLARAVANEVKAGFYYINGPDIVGTLYGETEANLRRMFAEAAHHAPSIVLIDEIDAIAHHREKAGAQSDVRMVTQLLALLDGLLKVDGVIVIGTTNRVDALDTALRRPGRLDQEIFIGPPDAEGRLEILKVHSREMPLGRSAIEHLPSVAAVTHGFVGADLMELCREAGLNALRRSSAGLLDHLAAFQPDDVAVEVEASDFDEAMKLVRPSAIREAFVSMPAVSWDDVGGLAEVKEELAALVVNPLRQPEVFRRAGIASSGGILLYGPPGTGKTLLAQALAHQSGVNFLALDGPEVFTKWLGESEAAIRQVFRVARQLAPSIVFFDQLDALAPSRSADSGSRTAERVVNQLLAELDGLEGLSNNIVVIAATNRIDLVDGSVLRPGRLGTHIYIPLPGLSERVEIFSLKLNGLPTEDPGAKLCAFLGERTEGLSGADIQGICTQAKLTALGRTKYAALPALARRDFEAAMEYYTRARIAHPDPQSPE